MAGVDSSAVPSVRTLGRYELFAKLGSGGMAEVHLARQRGLKRFRKLVVVKTVHPQLVKDERFVDLLLDEARISALLKHPRVVDIYDVDEDNGVVFIAMEYLPGQSVTAVIKAGRKGRKLDVLSAARIIADAAEGLDAAHNLHTHSGEALELVHRDVSPGNIVVLYSGEVKLVDFGVAKARDHLSSSAIGKFAGKLGYAAPEQLEMESADEADRRSDVFSLGVVLWELLCHRRLFPAKSREEALRLARSGKAPPPSSLRPEVPKELDAICLRALNPLPSARFQTAKEMYRQLESVLVGANYRRGDQIASYMDEVFADERCDTEALVRRISESTNQVSIAELASEDAATTIDEALPDKIAAAEREEEPIGIGESTAAAVGTAPGAQPILGRRFASLFSRGSQWRRPVLFGIIAVVGILLAVFVLEVATSGTTAATPPSAMAPLAAASDLGADAAGASDATASGAETPGSAALGSSGGTGEPDAGAIVLDAAAPPIKEARPPAKKREEAAGTHSPTPPKDPPPPPPEPAKPDREFAQSRYLEGARAYRSGNLAVASARMDEAIAADPGFAKAHRGMGLVNEKRGNHQAAIRSFRRYLKLSPNASDADRIQKIIDGLAKP